MGANQCCESNKNLRANNHNNNIPNSKKRDREYTPPGNYQRNNIETDEPGNQHNRQQGLGRGDRADRGGPEERD